MPLQIELNTLEQLSKEFGIIQIQNYFKILISNLSDYLGIEPVIKNIKIKLCSEDKGAEEDIDILDLGVRRFSKTNYIIIEIYEKFRKFLPFILLREAFYSFLPKDVNENATIKAYINQIVENHLEKATSFRKWHSLIRDNLVDRDFLVAQSDKLQKFFKIEDSEEFESPVQFFFKNIYADALLIGKRNIINYYDELFEKYTYKTSRSLYNEDIVITILILLKIFSKNKTYVNLTEYLNLYREYSDEKELKTNQSQSKFYENLQWINKFTPISPSYNIVYNLIGITPIHCELTFNPLLERKNIKKLIRNLPFVRAPRIVENGFVSKIILTLTPPKVYVKDLLNYLNRLVALGYLRDKKIFTLKKLKNFLNLNYFLDVSNTKKILDFQIKKYKREYECEHLIEYPSFETPIYPLSTFEYALLSRIQFLSVTGLTFDKRVETLNSIKEDIENEYRKQLTYIHSFKESFNSLLESTQNKEEFLLLLEKNRKQGFFFLYETFYTVLELTKSIKKTLIANPKITNPQQFIKFLEDNSISKVIEENISLQDFMSRRSIFNEILPKYFHSIKQYEEEIRKFQQFYDILESCYNLKIFSIETITRIIKNPKLGVEINKKKEERLKIAFKLVKSYKITNQKIESTINDFLTHDPPIIVPMLLNTVLTSHFAKFNPGALLKDTPEIREKLEQYKHYFPRIQITFLEDLDTKENIIHLFPYTINIAEKAEFYASLLNSFKDGLITASRFFWRGVVRISEISEKDFYDYESKHFFYTKDFFEQLLIYSQNILGKDELVGIKKGKYKSNHRLFWSPNINMKTLVNNVKKRISRQQINFDFNLITKFMSFYLKLEDVLQDQSRFTISKSSEFFKKYVKSIEFVPAFRKFGLGQYYLYFLPHDWKEINLRQLLGNTFQTVQFPAQIDESQPIFIKSIFPYNTPNSSYLNWLVKSKKAVQECCLFFLKRVYSIIHFDHNLSTTGWQYSSNRFKIHLQNILLNPNYNYQPQHIRIFDIDKHLTSGFYGLKTSEFEALSQIYSWDPLDIKSYLGTKKISLVSSITSLLKKKLIFPYINLKNLDLQDKVSIILPNLKTKQKTEIINIFSFFNICRIYEIEGSFYINGFKDLQSFETGFMIEIWFPKCELDEFFEVFDLLFEYMNVKHYLFLTDLVEGKTLIKNVFGNLDFLEHCNPLTNLKWNERDKIWMNHKLFNERFEPIYPDMCYGNKRDNDK